MLGLFTGVNCLLLLLFFSELHEYIHFGEYRPGIEKPGKSHYPRTPEEAIPYMQLINSGDFEEGRNSASEERSTSVFDNVSENDTTVDQNARDNAEVLATALEDHVRDLEASNTERINHLKYIGAIRSDQELAELKAMSKEDQDKFIKERNAKSWSDDFAWTAMRTWEGFEERILRPLFKDIAAMSHDLVTYRATGPRRPYMKVVRTPLPPM
jgi:hypothetical protein